MNEATQILKSKNNISEEVADEILNNGLNGLSTRDIVNNPNSFDEEIKDLIKQSQGDLDVLYDIVNSLENSLVIQYNSGINEIEMDLKSLTVFKYSLIFWRDALENSCNPWYYFIQSAYIKHELKYIDYKPSLNNKSLFGDICAKISKFSRTACDWVVDKFSNIVSTVAYGAIFDAGSACVLLENGITNPYVVGGVSGAFSGLGIIYGWNNPLWKWKCIK